MRPACAISVFLTKTAIPCELMFEYQSSRTIQRLKQLTVHSTRAIRIVDYRCFCLFTVLYHIIIPMPSMVIATLYTGPSEGKMKCYGLVDGRRPWPPKEVFGGGSVTKKNCPPAKNYPRTKSSNEVRANKCPPLPDFVPRRVRTTMVAYKRQLPAPAGVKLRNGLRASVRRRSCGAGTSACTCW